MWTDVRFCWKYHPAESQGLVCLTGKCQWEVNWKLNFNKVELFLPQFTSNLLPVQKYLYSLSCIDIKKYIKIVGQLNYTWASKTLSHWPGPGASPPWLHHYRPVFWSSKRCIRAQGSTPDMTDHQFTWVTIYRPETCSDTTYQNTNPLGYCSQLTNLIFGGLNWYLNVKALIVGVFLLWGLSSKSSLFLLKIIFARSDCERIEVNVQTLSGNQTVRSHYCLTRVISTAIKWDQSRFSKDCN